MCIEGSESLMTASRHISSSHVDDQLRTTFPHAMPQLLKDHSRCSGCAVLPVPVEVQFACLLHFSKCLSGPASRARALCGDDEKRDNGSDAHIPCAGTHGSLISLLL
jgi:hypothetical protein